MFSFGRTNSAKNSRALLPTTTDEERGVGPPPPALTEVHDETSTHATSELFFGRVLQPHAEELGYGFQEYCWLEGKRFQDPGQFTKLCGVWGLQMPNLVISLRSGDGPHPATMVTEGDLRQPDIQAVLTNAQKVRQMQEKIAQSMPASSSEPTVPVDAENIADALADLGDDLQDKVTAIVVALLEACAQTNSWLVLSSAVAPAVATYLLEAALGRTAARPVILAVIEYDNPLFRTPATEDFVNQGVTVRAKKPIIPLQDLSWAKLRNHAQNLPSDTTSDNLPVLRLSEDLMPEGLADCWPRKGEISSFFAGRHPWGFWPFRGASHYIFASTWNPFPLTWMGPVGSVWISGGSAAADTMYSSIQAGEPNVVLKHTGRAANIFGNLLDIILQSKQSSYDPQDVMKLLQERYPVFKDFEGDLYGIAGLDERIFRIVSGICSQAQTSLSRMKSSVVVIDSWKDSPELVLQRLSSCFASTSTGVKELGASAAEDEVIITALERQMLLEDNSEVFARWANWMTTLALTLSFTSTFVAVASTFVETKAEETWARQVMESSAWDSVGWALLFLPAAGGFFMSLLSRLRYTAKWGTLHLAARQMQSEIYKFRVKAGDYEITQAQAAPTDKKEKDAAKATGGVGEASKRSRDLFIARTCELFARAVSTEMREDSLQADPYIQEKLRARQLKSLEETAAKVRARQADMMTLRSRKSDKDGNQDESTEALLEQGGPEEADGDDLVSSMSAEAYLEMRVLGELAHFQELAPKLSSRLTAYEILVFLASLAGTLLGACQIKEWIPVAVALSSVLTSLMQYESLSGRLGAVNSAIADLSTIVSKWRSYGVVEKRTRSVRSLVVSIAENAIVGEAVAYVAGAAQAASTSQKQEEQAEKSDGKDAGQDQKQKAKQN